MKTKSMLIGMLALMTAACADRDWEPATDTEGEIDKDLLGKDQTLQFWHLHLFGKYAVFRN
ncbi:MAG: hypothetical protein K2M62_06880 [Muribaculaceae bacterium]|nr:hypothetical protein [Muribaculaceae bacterium]